MTTEQTLDSPLTGASSHTVDIDGRFIVPARMRDLLGMKFVVTRGIEDCLWLLPQWKYKQMLQEFPNASVWDSRSREFHRRFVGHAVVVKPDKQGRVVIPAELRNPVDAVGDVLAFAIGDYVELWSKKVWGKYDSALSSESIRNAVDSLAAGVPPGAGGPQPADEPVTAG